MLRGVEVLVEALEPVIDAPMRARERARRIEGLFLGPFPEANR
jgi:hypothetical protein